MKYNKIFIIVIVMLFGIRFVFGQTENMQKDYLDIVPSSPNASSLVKLIDTPVSEFTGTMETDIPLYEIDFKGYKMPITMTYKTNGIKVDEMSSWVGLGWTLDVGGVIARTVRGVPDDRYQSTGSYKSYGLFYSSEEIDLLKNGNTQTKLENDWKFAAGVYENEPDIFYFKVPGYSGKFYFDKNKNVHLCPKQNILITPHLEDQSPITSFTLITPDGIIYKFNDVESIETNLPRDHKFNSTWQLSKIVTQTDSILLTYADEDILEKKLPGELKLYYDDAWHDLNRTVTIPEVRFHTKRLTNISWPYGHINFTASHIRQDVSRHAQDTHPSYALTSLIISDSENSTIGSYLFDYDYFDSSSGISTDIYLYKRLRLKKIEEVDAEGIKKLPYVFTYATTALPARNSTEQDYWGFFNDNNATTMVPNLYFYPSGGCNNIYQSQYSIIRRINYTNGEYSVSVGANRSSNANVIETGILKSITYPTGGDARFFYQQNTFIHDGTEVSGGGLRIWKVEKYDNNILKNSKEYLYQNPETNLSSGAVLSIPNFAHQRTLKIENIANITDLLHNTFFSINNMSETDVFNGINVFYEYATIKETGNGSVVKKFDIPEIRNNEIRLNYGNNGYLSLSRTKPVNYGGSSLVSINGTGYWSYTDSIPVKDYFPYSPLPDMSWCMGQLKEEHIYTEGASAPIKSMKYRYNYNQVDFHDAFSVGFFDMDLNLAYFFNIPILVFTNYDVVQQYTNMSGIKQLVSEETINYFPEQGNRSVVDSAEYEYNSANQLSMIKKWNSDGSFIRNTYKYPSDYVSLILLTPTNINSRSLKVMLLKNIINEPVEIVSYKNSSVINAQVVKYKMHNSIIVEDSILCLDIVAPIDNYAPMNPSANAVAHDSRLNYKIVFGNYDNYGNILDVKTRDGLTTTYTWNSNGQYPLSKTITGGATTLAENWEWYPLIGMKSYTNQSGVKTSYKYDDFGRLSEIKNDDSKLLKKYTYNYATN